MSVGRICIREVDLAESAESVLVAAQRMAQRRVGTLVVLDAERRPIGLLTDRDVAFRAVAAGRNPAKTTVGEIMTRDLVVAHEETPIEEALRRMRAAAVRRLPVVDRRGRLVGILSLDDVLELLAEEFAQIGGLLANQNPAHRAVRESMERTMKNAGGAHGGERSTGPAGAKAKGPLARKRILVVIAPMNFDPTELRAVRAAWEDAGARVDVASTAPAAEAGDGGRVEGCLELEKVDPEGYDAVVVLGGGGAETYLWEQPLLHRLLRRAHERGAVVGGLSHGAAALARAGLLHHVRATVFGAPEAVRQLERANAHYVEEPIVVEGRIVTAASPAFAAAFAAALAGTLSGLDPVAAEAAGRRLAETEAARHREERRALRAPRGRH